MALSLAGQALEQGDTEHADFCLRFAERWFRAHRGLLRADPGAFEWHADMLREDRERAAGG